MVSPQYGHWIAFALSSFGIDRTLFVTQRIDRIEPGGFSGRRITEKDTDADRKQEGQYDNARAENKRHLQH